MSIIESFIPGRIRLRSSLIRNRELRRVILSAFQDIRGIREAAANGLTGSLLITYDPGVLTAERLLPLLPCLNSLAEIEQTPDLPGQTEALRKILTAVQEKLA